MGEEARLASREPQGWTGKGITPETPPLCPLGSLPEPCIGDLGTSPCTATRCELKQPNSTLSATVWFVF